MRIKSVHLKNIRSYEDQLIELPEGSTLLSGDIGCGKSTILQSLEFALFGLRKGELEGTDMLRHGKNTGSVTANFDLAGNDIIIERNLKRGKSISQDSCKIIINNKPDELTPVELKSKILDMIGYSQDLLKKNKPIFRFTVYTPQEEMKKILADEEDRLEILRSIFGIDKYGAIRNNSRTFMTELRRMKTGLEGELKVMDFEVGRMEELRTGREIMQSTLHSQRLLLQEAVTKADAKKSDLDILKKSFAEANTAKHEMVRKETEIFSKKRRIDQISTELAENEERLSSYTSLLSQMQAIRPLGDLKKQLADKESKKDLLVSERAVINSEIRKMQEIKTKGVCGFCRQKVHNPDEFAAHIDEMNRRITAMDEESSVMASVIVEIKNFISLAEKAEHYQGLINDLNSRKARLVTEKSYAAADVSTLESSLETLKPKAEKYDYLQSRITEIEAEFYALQKSRSDVERNVARYEQQLEDVEKRMAEIKTKMEQAQKTREKVEKISSLLLWFEHFIALTETMEKHVMLTIQKEFNEYFQKWFFVLMNEQLSVKIDDRFSPVIEQNGYITEYDNLSGGEKTSVALAYRLALNKVINSMIDTIRTKDLLILDEPTDGFSSDQLDRVRDVISELNLKQVIIVSHEQKIDAYVDNVIRIYKENHVSKVAY